MPLRRDILRDVSSETAPEYLKRRVGLSVATRDGFSSRISILFVVRCIPPAACVCHVVMFFGAHGYAGPKVTEGFKVPQAASVAQGLGDARREQFCTTVKPPKPLEAPAPRRHPDATLAYSWLVIGRPSSKHVFRSACVGAVRQWAGSDCS